MSEDTQIKLFLIPPNEFSTVEEVCTSIGNDMTQRGICSNSIRNTRIVLYESIVNAIIHGNGGVVEAEYSKTQVIIRVIDNGSGIPNLDEAMRDGYTTASYKARKNGFGAGKGMGNMRKYCDDLKINTQIGVGTEIVIIVKT